MRTVLSEYSGGGVTMQNVVYQWRKNEVLSECDHHLTLKYLRERRSVRAHALDAGGAAHRIGQIILSPPDIVFGGVATADEPRQRSTIFHFDGDLIARLLRACGGDIAIGDLEADLDLRVAAVDGVLVRLAAELSRPQLGSENAIEMLTQLLIIDLVRHTREEREAAGAAVPLSAARLDHIRAFIAQFEVGFPSPSEVAAECGMSASHLRRLFKRQTGQTLQEFLSEQRIERARILLRQTDMPLKAISYRLGFGHCSAFSAAFRSAIGETPGQFRRQAAIDEIGTPSGMAA